MPSTNSTNEADAAAMNTVEKPKPSDDGAFALRHQHDRLAEHEAQAERHRVA